MTKKNKGSAANSVAANNRVSQSRTLNSKIRGRGDYDLSSPTLDKLTTAVQHIDSRIKKMEGSTGGMKSSVGQAASLAGRAAGTLLGNSNLGQLAAEKLAGYFGYGDYDVHRNSLMGKGADVGLTFEKDGRRGTRIIEREYIGDLRAGGTIVNGASTFNIQGFPINPGMPQTFPWLSSIAQQFEEYRPNGIIFEFISTSSVYNGTSQALGVVVTATDYDPSDALYVNKLQMESADYSMSCKASDNLLHGIECDPKERGDAVLYVRSSGVPSTDNVKFYDLGIFQIATQGMSVAGVTLGEVWVSYDITFYKKQLLNGILGNNVYTSIARSLLTPTAAVPFSTSVAKSGSFALDIASNGTVTFPSFITAGVYSVEFFTDQVTVNPGQLQFTTFANCTNISASYIGSTLAASSVWNAANSFSRIILRIDGVNASFRCEASGYTWGGSGSTNLLVTQLPLVPSVQ